MKYSRLWAQIDNTSPFLLLVLEEKTSTHHTAWWPAHVLTLRSIVMSKAAHYKYTLPREGAGQHDQTSPLNHRLWECFDGVRPQFRTSCSLGHFWKTSPATICISFCICICISQFRTSYSLGHFSKNISCNHICISLLAHLENTDICSWVIPFSFHFTAAWLILVCSNHLQMTRSCLYWFRLISESKLWPVVGLLSTQQRAAVRSACLRVT